MTILHSYTHALLELQSYRSSYRRLHSGMRRQLIRAVPLAWALVRARSAVVLPELSSAAVGAMASVSMSTSSSASSLGGGAPPASMRAVVARADGHAAVTTRDVPVPQKGELLVRVQWTAINRADTLQRRGKYDPPPGATDVLGLEAAGVVAAVGPGCSGPLAVVGARTMALLSGVQNGGVVGCRDRRAR